MAIRDAISVCYMREVMRVQCPLGVGSMGGFVGDYRASIEVNWLSIPGLNSSAFPGHTNKEPPGTHCLACQGAFRDGHSAASELPVIFTGQNASSVQDRFMLPGHRKTFWRHGGVETI